MSTDRLLTLEEVAGLLRLSKHTIRALTKRGKLRPVRICRRLLFNPADVEQLIARNSEPMDAQPR